MINLSQNELWALLTKVFEAIYGHRRDYYDMARTVQWMECHGLGGVEHLVGALPTLERKNLPQPSLSATTTLDGGGRSLFCLGRTACDLVMANAAETGAAHLELHNVWHVEALIGLLPYASGQGFAMAALWPGGGAVIGPNETCPDIFAGTSSEPIRLVCVKAAVDLKIPDNLRLSQRSKMMQACYDEGLETGIRISKTHYAVLNAVADRVLVAASEASRRGAGE